MRSEVSSRIVAWAVHLFTASGVVLGMLALAAVECGAEVEALLWLGAALIVDGIDGSLARMARVRELLPNVDGEALDLVVDYLTYVFVPALLIWRGAYLPGPLALAVTAVILVSSLYVFARRDMKTDDGYFRGFPALWNVVALYYVILRPTPEATAAAAVVLAAMTFAPVHVVHPFRARDYGWALPATAILWAVTTAALLVPIGGQPMEAALLILSLASAALLTGMGLLRTFRGPRRGRPGVQ